MIGQWEYENLLNSIKELKSYEWERIGIEQKVDGLVNFCTSLVNVLSLEEKIEKKLKEGKEQT